MLFSYEKNSKITDIGLLVLRVALGLIMLFSHGWPKLLKLFGEGPIKFPDPLGLGAEASLVLAVFAEVFCSALLALGLATRAAVIPLIITMLVAVLIVHGDDPFKKQEFGILYLLPYLLLLLTGAGRFSIDSLISKK